MKNIKNILTTTLQVIIFIGIFVGLLFAFQFAKENLLPAKGNQGNSLGAYPAPGSTQVYTPSPTSKPFPSQTQTPTLIVLENGWYLYIDKDAGYSLSYPPDAYFHTSKEGRLPYKTVHIQFKISGSGYQGIEVNVLSNTMNLSLESIVQEVNSNINEKPSLADIQASLKPMTIGKLSAFKSVYQPSIAEFRIFVPIGNNVLYATPVTTMGLTAFDPQARELFEKILATLTLNP
jgi:hypothetical protein